MSDRERLIELLQEWGNKENDGVRAESIADYLLENGVIVLPVKVGQTVQQMNERYLFRGKRTDNGKWEFGLLARYDKKYPCANIIDEMELLIPIETITV